MKYLTYLLPLLLLVGCNSTTNNEQEETPFEEQLMNALINAQEGDVIEIPEGTFEFKRQLSLNDVPNITIKGAGMKKSILSFKNQVEGAEGFIIKGVKGITLEDLSIRDSKGDALKIQACENVILRSVEAAWTGGPQPTNGAYGLYPVNCTNVLMEKCEASYAMDAGVYVGQSENIVVRGCYAHHNVAGIEIENSKKADVYDNTCENNTGGLLIFDMPDLPKANGNNISVHDNTVMNNNFQNFSAEGIVVNILPPGTGMLLMAHKNMDVYNNTIQGHNTIGLGLISWLFTERPFDSKEYDPFCSAIHIYNNEFTKGEAVADTTTDFGKLLAVLFQGQPQDIVTDGIFNPQHFDESGKMKEDKAVCIRNNGEISFVNLQAGKGSKPEEMAKNMDTDLTPFDCERAPVDIEGHNAWLQ